jgi:molybdate transport system substrate-binding protein
VTDVTAKVAPRVHTIAIPAGFNQIAQYPIAVVAGSRNAALARTFVAYVLSPTGQSVLRRSGFIAPGAAGDLRSTHTTRAVAATVVGAP